MNRGKVVLTGLVAFVGALLLLGLTVYPFQYGPLESALLAGAFVVAALFELVLDGARFGAEGTDGE